MNREEKRYLHFVVAYNIAFLIPLIIISFFVMHLFWEQQLQNVDTEANRILERQTGYWKQQISSMRAFNKSCKFDKKYNGGYADDPMTVFEICDDFSKQEMTFSFVDEICVYDVTNDIVLTSDGKISKELFFSYVCKMDQSVFGENLEESKIYAYAASYPKDQEEGVVFMAPIRTWGANEAETNFFLYLVKNDTLDYQFGKTAGDGFSVLLLEEEVFYTSYEGELEVSWQEAYQNFIEGEEYITYSRDLGAGFSITIFFPKNNIWEGMQIYLKGYGSYFLCSLIIGILLLLYFTRSHYRIYQNLISNKTELIIERDKLKREGCLYELLLNTVSLSDELLQKCLTNNIRIDRQHKFFIAHLEEMSKNLNEKLEKLLSIEGTSEIYKIELLEGVCVYLLCSDEMESVLNGKLKELKKEQIGIGRMVEDAGELRKSYEEAIKKINKYIYKDNNYPKREISSLDKAVQEGNLLKAELMLEEICSVIGDMDEISVIAILWNIADILQLDKDETIDFIRNGEGSVYDKAKQLLICVGNKMFNQTLEKASGNSYKKRSIEEVTGYVYEHYLDDNFSVKYMAAYFNTSVSNISHFFKKNTGVTISQYVENIKLESAKQMLRESDKRISEIASTLRYANSTVFIEMFKRYEGMTPGNYREMVQKEKQQLCNLDNEESES